MCRRILPEHGPAAKNETKEKARRMNKKVGLWIDHKKAVIFSLADEGAELKRISSEGTDPVRLSGGSQKESPGKHQDNRFTSHLNKYYDEILSYIRDAESILIFGPGEAKVELKKRLESMELHKRIIGFEIVDKMTDNQIVSKVRQHYLH
jgi:stalled ribosome rescue protein Dom34